MGRKKWRDINQIEDLDSQSQPQPEQDGQSRLPCGIRTSAQKKAGEVIVSAKTLGQKQYMQAIQENDIVFCAGPAGSGKTVIAAGLGLQMLLAGKYQKIVVLRPAIEACHERIGFLPGSADEKLQPWTAPVFDNMEVFLKRAVIKDLVIDGKIETVPLGFVRGRSFNNAFIVVDESQNLSVKQTLLVLTRLGQDSKMIFNGDLTQSDLSESNGLADSFDRLQDIKGIGFVSLDASDIVRHRLIGQIIERYQKK